MPTFPPVIYLGCPYSHPSRETRSDREEIATVVAARIAQAGYAVFSPITHGPALANHLPMGVSHSHHFWMAQCLPILERCDMLFILPLPGWRNSRGLSEEIALAYSAGKPVVLIQRLPDPWEARIEQIPESQLSMLGWKVGHIGGSELWSSPQAPH
jgi:hypothetical protein